MNGVKSKIADTTSKLSPQPPPQAFEQKRWSGEAGRTPKRASVPKGLGTHTSAIHFTVYVELKKTWPSFDKMVDCPHSCNSPLHPRKFPENSHAVGGRVGVRVYSQVSFNLCVEAGSRSNSLQPPHWNTTYIYVHCPTGQGNRCEKYTFLRDATRIERKTPNINQQTPDPPRHDSY